MLTSGPETNSECGGDSWAIAGNGISMVHPNDRRVNKPISSEDEYSTTDPRGHLPVPEMSGNLNISSA